MRSVYLTVAELLCRIFTALKITGYSDITCTEIILRGIYTSQI